MWYDKITGSGRGQMSDYKNTLKNLSTIDSVSYPLSLSLSLSLTPSYHLSLSHTD